MQILYIRKGEMHMTRDCWKDFAVSGKVSDYLRYCEQEHRREEEAPKSGVKNGTDSCPDRHGTFSNACR